jgi:hypothetical protein
MPGVSGVLVVTNARAYYHYTRGCGCSGARHSLRPLIGEGGKFLANLGQIRPRDREYVSVATVDTPVVPGLDPGIHPSSQETFLGSRWI